MGVSRRLFLHRLGAVGGLGAAYSAMTALGLNAAVAAIPPTLSPQLGQGRKVVILGAGIAGLVCAYELERAGFDVTVLEGRDRLGGRNWTLRGGDKVEMVGEADQTVAFEKDVYLNAGPARIPSHHEGLLGYCRRLGVPLEVEINVSRSALIWGEGAHGGKPIQMRQGINDTRGHVSELLAKAINKGALDGELTLEDKEKLLPFLRAYGDLSEDMSFQGTERSGFAQAPGAADQFSQRRPPVPLRDLLANPQIRATVFEDNINMQATMFQPTGGMDQIVAGFERAIKCPVIRNAKVTAIARAGEGVQVAYDQGGARRTVLADHAIITIPLAILTGIENDFSPAVKTAVGSVPNAFSNKIGFESPRFWEKSQIYGGISWVGGDTSLIWYPSNGLHTERGMLLACYGSGPRAEGFAALPLEAQIAAARAAVGRVHPGHEGELTKPVVVNWSKIPFSHGPWPNWQGDSAQEGHMDMPAYRLLNQPDGPFHFTGAHLSQMPGWQEGAVLSAHRTIKALAAQVQATALAQPRVAAS
ncbi:MAG: FAD-dependent oxidoreductase [Phenylobacterium sp.]|nr:FAD-dependent oxidoreductase [Phenylobacterium sp.]